MEDLHLLQEKQKSKESKGKIKLQEKQLAKLAASGESIDDLQAEIELLEQELLDLK